MRRWTEVFFARRVGFAVALGVGLVRGLALGAETLGLTVFGTGGPGALTADFSVVFLLNKEVFSE